VLGTASFGDARGTVTTFDVAVGLGEITGDDGATYRFHCTAITDGTRSIDVGKSVTFTIVAGHMGRLEATAIT
jgi:cold shock CspA family protein